MIPKAYKKYINKIIELTEDNKIIWDIADDKEYSCKTSDATISVSSFFHIDENLSYFLFSFFDFEKQHEVRFRVSNENNDFEVMERLYTVAAASAINIESELESFISEFEKE